MPPARFTDSLSWIIAPSYASAYKDGYWRGVVTLIEAGVERPATLQRNSCPARTVRRA